MGLAAEASKKSPFALEDKSLLTPRNADTGADDREVWAISPPIFCIKNGVIMASAPLR